VAASRAKGGWWWRCQGSWEVEVEERATNKAGDEAAACSEARDEAVVSSKARDEATACSRAGLEDDRRQQCDNVQGDRRARALGGFKKLLSVARDSIGPEILGHGDLMRDAPLLHTSPFSSYGKHA
jgi:hypothetical protein